MTIIVDKEGWVVKIVKRKLDLGFLFCFCARYTFPIMK
jgi:hypothetical protein